MDRGPGRGVNNLSSDLQSRLNSTQLATGVRRILYMYLGSFYTPALSARLQPSICRVILTSTQLHELLRRRHSNQLDIPQIELLPPLPISLLVRLRGFFGVD